MNNLYDNCCILFDIEGMYYSANNSIKSSKVDYKKVYDKILNYKIRGRQRKISIAIAYIICSEENNQSLFKKFLNDLGVVVKEKIVKRYDDNINWNSQMIIDAIEFINEYNIFALCSCNDDFIPLIKYLKSNRKYIEVYAFENSVSNELISSADKIWYLRKRHLLLPKENSNGTEKFPFRSIK